MSNLKATEINRKLIFILIFSLVGFSFLAFIVKQFSYYILSWDSSILLAIHNQSQPILDKIAINTTNLGGLVGIIILIFPIVLLLVSQKQWRPIGYLITTIISSSLVILFVKLFFQRMRPHFWELSYLPHGFSFPSGHAMGSMTLVIAVLLITRGTIWGTICLILGSLYLLLIAWTRLYLGVHYPSDILGGWLLAVVWAIFVYLLFNLEGKYQSKEQ